MCIPISYRLEKFDQFFGALHQQSLMGHTKNTRLQIKIFTLVLPLCLSNNIRISSVAVSISRHIVSSFFNLLRTNTSPPRLPILQFSYWPTVHRKLSGASLSRWQLIVAMRGTVSEATNREFKSIEGISVPTLLLSEQTVAVVAAAVLYPLLYCHTLTKTQRQQVLVKPFAFIAT